MSSEIYCLSLRKMAPIILPNIKEIAATAAINASITSESCQLMYSIIPYTPATVRIFLSTFTSTSVNRSERDAV